MNIVWKVLRLSGCWFFVLALPMIAMAQAQKSSRTAAPEREDIEWLDVWTPDTAVVNLPRILLVGDSITRAYYPEVAEKFKGKATVARLATSKSLGDPAYLAELNMLLSQYHFDVIHFNNGMHGWGYTEEQYAAAFPELISNLKKQAPGAKLIWATTTPVREKGALEKLSARTDRVKERNKIAAGFIQKENIPIDDLYSLVLDHPEYYKPDGTHFNPSGTAVQAEQVAQQILKQLNK